MKLDQVAEDEDAARRMHNSPLSEVAADKGYHSNDVLIDLKDWEIRSYISEPDRGRRNWKGKKDAQAAVYANRRRIKGGRGQALRKLRAEKSERGFNHAYDHGGMRRLHLRDRGNILKRLLIHIGACNLGLLMRSLIGVGTPKGFGDVPRMLIYFFTTAKRRFKDLFKTLIGFIRGIFETVTCKPYERSEPTRSTR